MKKFLTLLISIAIVYSCSTSNDGNGTTPKNITYINIPGPNVIDIDGNVYESVTNCGLTFTKQNLNVSNYTDGTPIPQVTSSTQWAYLTTGAWCYYENTTANGTTYGKLYNWYAVAGIYDEASLTNSALRKKLAPTGWHIPTEFEWGQLISCLGGQSVAGGKMKTTGISLWQTPNTAATNESGLTGLPGGSRAITDPNSLFSANSSFFDIGNKAIWWSSSESSARYGSFQVLNYNLDSAINTHYFKAQGFSVRCLKD